MTEESRQYGATLKLQGRTWIIFTPRASKPQLQMMAVTRRDGVLRQAGNKSALLRSD